MQQDRPTASSVTPLTLVSHHLCPYVQRAAIVLSEKGTPFERRYIDLAAKPDWFLSLSPLGKVPLLLIGSGNEADAVLFESAVICEYLEDSLPDVPLHPSEPLARAKHRGWIEFGSSILSDVWGLETAKDAETYEGKRQALIAKFARVEAELGDRPYLRGERFSLVDAAYAPIFRYFDVFDRIMQTCLFDGYPRVRAWRTALATRPSVREAVTADYAERLHGFLEHHGAWLLRGAA